jgi:hypothetical protein
VPAKGLCIGKGTLNPRFQGKLEVGGEVFCKNDLCIRKVSQKLPDAYEKKVLNFQKYVCSFQQQHSYIH